jgi:hypothetical protein
MTGDMFGLRTRQRKLHFVPERAGGPSLSIKYIHDSKGFSLPLGACTSLRRHRASAEDLQLDCVNNCGPAAGVLTNAEVSGPTK